MRKVYVLPQKFNMQWLMPTDMTEQTEAGTN